MSARDRISPELLAELLRYEPSTGTLYWRARTPAHFDSDTPVEHCASWNARHANKATFQRKTSNGALSGRVFHYTILAARAAFCLHWGHWPKGVVSHYNGDKTDTRIDNLRDVDERVQRQCRLALTRGDVPPGPTPMALWGLHYSHDQYIEDKPQEGHGGTAPTQMTVAGPDLRANHLESGPTYMENRHEQLK